MGIKMFTLEEALKNSIKADEGNISPFIASKGRLEIKDVSPFSIFVSWDVSELPEKIMEIYFQEKFAGLVTLIRIYDVTDLNFNGKNAHHFYEIAIPYHNGYWNVKGLEQNRSYIAEMGVYTSKFGFFPFFRSNHIQTQSSDRANEKFQDTFLNRCDKENSPKWLEHVSTYSYYGETKDIGEKDE